MSPKAKVPHGRNLLRALVHQGLRAAYQSHGMFVRRVYAEMNRQLRVLQEAANQGRSFTEFYADFANRMYLTTKPMANLLWRYGFGYTHTSILGGESGKAAADLTAEFDNPLLLERFQATRVDEWLRDTVTVESKTRVNQLAKLVQKEKNEGVASHLIARDLRDQGIIYDRHRANLLAQTAMTWSYNDGAKAAYKTAGVNVMEWSVANDELLCEFCSDMDGVRVPIDGAFLQEGESLQSEAGHTLDTIGAVEHPPLHPFCRCTLLPVTEDVLIRDVLEDPSQSVDLAGALDQERLAEREAFQRGLPDRLTCAIPKGKVDPGLGAKAFSGFNPNALIKVAAGDAAKLAKLQELTNAYTLAASGGDAAVMKKIRSSLRKLGFSVSKAKLGAPAAAAAVKGPKHIATSFVEAWKKTKPSAYVYPAYKHKPAGYKPPTEVAPGACIPENAFKKWADVYAQLPPTKGKLAARANVSRMEVGLVQHGVAPKHAEEMLHHVREYTANAGYAHNLVTKKGSKRGYAILQDLATRNAAGKDVLYRGVGWDALSASKGRKFMAAFEEGKEFVWPSLSSFTQTPSIAARFASGQIKVQIRVEGKRLPGLVLRKVSAFPSENEVLFPEGVKMRVVKKTVREVVSPHGFPRTLCELVLKAEGW